MGIETGRLLWVLFSMTCMVLSLPAQLTGRDEFNGPFKNTNYWDDDFEKGSAEAYQKDGSFLLRSPASTGEHEAGWPWIQSSARYAEDWSFQVDLHNEVDVETASQFASIGVYVASLEDERNMAFIECYSTLFESGGERIHGFASGLVNAEGHVHEGDSLDLQSTAGAVQVRFDSKRKHLTLLYHSGDTTEGYAWRRLAQYGIAGDKGKEGTDHWQLRSSSELDIGIYGFAKNVAVVEGQLRLDNFTTTASPTLEQPPFEIYLESSATGGKELWWQAYDGFEYVTQHSLDLGDWNPSPAPIMDMGDWQFISVFTNPSNQFFRVLSTQP